MPYDVAFSLSNVDVNAYGIIFGEFEGQEFSWSTMTWKQQK